MFACSCRLQRHVPELIFGAVERRREIVEAVHRQQLHPRVLRASRRRDRTLVSAICCRPSGRLVLEVPVAADGGVIVGPVGQRRLVAEVAEQIVVQRADEGAGDGASLRIVIGAFADHVRLGADVARIDPADDLVTVAQQLAPEAVRTATRRFERRM